ncbi:DUF3566 domain-containing protein [Nocardioides sp. 1609]|uniref:DUF3566 domain-containing protein n=1 Tax=Nocardioides sp. 1609 TaxID=2508327 RepID=UPI0010703C91|nr:DUF3566 domain-containing protein [Nocardioides sp. 1609]
MSDRPAPTSPPPTTPPPAASPTPQARTPKPPQAPKQPKPSKQPRPDASPGAGDTVVRPGLAERIQAKLAGGDRPDDGADRDTDRAAPTATSKATKAKQRGPRRARLRLTRIDPWSVMKTAFLLSIAFGIVTVVAVAMIWEVIGAAGVWTSINDTVKEVVNEPSTADFDIEDYVGTERVLGFTMLVAAVDVVLITAIATLTSFLYNMSAALLGGIEVTLAEDN